MNQPVLVPYSDELRWPEDLTPFETVNFEIQKNPYRHYAWMRENAPVLRARGKANDVWFVSRYDDVRSALRDPKRFSSVVVDPIPLVFLTLFDPPDHTRLRKVAASSFTPKAVSQFEAQITEFADGCLKKLIASGGGDVVEGFALRVTMATISGLLGVPAQDFDQMKRWSDDISSYFGRLARQAPGTPNDEDGANAFFAYMSEHLRRAKSDSRETMGRNIATLLDEGVITEREAIHFCAFLFVAGHETTTVLLANSFRQFMEEPHLLERIRNNPGDAKLFVEEMVRYRGTVHRLSRRAKEDIVVAGALIPKNDIVVVLPASANRDDAVFANGDLFDMDRDQSAHLGFGHGIHSCLGQHLARLEGRIGVSLIAQQIGAVTLRAPDSIDFIVGGNLANCGPSYLDARLVPQMTVAAEAI